MKISLRDKKISPWDMKIQNFLMWFKNGLGASALSGRVEFTCESSIKHKKIERYYKPQIRNLLGFVGFCL